MVVWVVIVDWRVASIRVEVVTLILIIVVLGPRSGLFATTAAGEGRRSHLCASFNGRRVHLDAHFANLRSY